MSERHQPTRSWLGGDPGQVLPGSTTLQSPIRVLVVDDDSGFTHHLASFLEDRHEFTVVVEASPHAALDSLTNGTSAASSGQSVSESGEHSLGLGVPSMPSAEPGRGNDQEDGPIHCVVCAYELPELDGLELLEAIREERASIPVILVAEAGSEAIASEACLRGASEYLPKDTDPEHLNQLANRIRSAVSLHEHVRQLRSFRQAVEHAGHAIYITDPEGVILFVNPAFEASTGYRAEEVLGRTPSILRSGVHDDAFYEELWETILGGDVWENEVVNEKKNGEQFVVEQTIAPVTDEHGAITHFVAINNDITELKRRESELERQNQRLEEFARTLTHDLRNPLNVAYGAIELAERKGDAAYFDRARRNLDRMDTMIEDALTLAKLGLTVQDPQPVRLGRVVRSAWDTVPTASSTLLSDIPEETLLVADESRLAELIENLFRNAIEHGSPSDRAGEPVTLRVGVLDDRPGFYVADDGTGIPEEVRDEVFEAGFSTKEAGTGLGLSIVREIAAAHDWGIEIRESWGGGARFEFAVPAEHWNEPDDT